MTPSAGGLVSMSCLTLTTSWSVACQTPLTIEFSRQEYCNGLPFPSLGDLPDPEIELWSRVSCNDRKVLYQLSHQDAIYNSVKLDWLNIKYTTHLQELSLFTPALNNSCIVFYKISHNVLSIIERL